MSRQSFEHLDRDPACCVGNRHSGPPLVLCACVAWLASGLLVAGGVAVGARVSREGGTPILDVVFRFDAPHYMHLVEQGYRYSPERASEVAFFPGYPMTARIVKRVTGASSALAMLAVTHVCLIGAFVLLAGYLGVRSQEPGARGQRVEKYALWAFALLPTTFFMRMPYTESMFVLVTLLALYGMERCWPLSWIAAIVGLATAVRSVGVALLLPLAWYAWRDSGRQTAKQGALTLGFVGKLVFRGRPGVMHNPAPR